MAKKKSDSIPTYHSTKQVVEFKANIPPNAKLLIDDALHNQTSDKVDLISFTNQIQSTSAIISGTITALNSTLKEIENATYARLEPNFTAQVTESIEPLKTELDLIKNQLQNVKDSLEPIGKTLLENAAFFSNSISAQGKIQSIESSISSIFIRLDKIENDNNIRWNRRSTVINILFTILGTAIALLGIAVTYWLGLLK